MLTQLDQIRQENFNCTACSMRASCQNVVCGRGNIHSRFMFIGDKPNAVEDKYGRPFLGRAGVVLDRLLEHAGLTRDKIYLTYCLKCLGKPKVEHYKECKQWLSREIRVVKPHTIFLLGQKPTELITGQKLSKVNGIAQVYYFDDFNCVCVPMLSLDRIGKSNKLDEYKLLIRTYTR